MGSARKAQKEQPAMEYGAIDLHSRRSQIRMVREDGTVILDRRVDTTRADLEGLFGRRETMRVLLESSTESEWVAQHLEALGHEVIVADPNYAPMYGSRSRKVKTDKRDAAALAEACRTGVYRRAHRVSPAARHLRQQMRVRQHLVAMRTRTINLLRALVRQDGVRWPTGSAERVIDRLDGLALPARLQTIVAPVRESLLQLQALLDRIEDAVEARAAGDATTQCLMTAPGVGPIVALTFQAVLDEPGRFGGQAARASAFVGLVPSEQSSAERQHKGAITKTGPKDLRALLVQASWCVWRGRSQAGAALRTWAHALAARRGRRIAIVALARRLTRILYAMWRDQRPFQAPRPRVEAVA
jgi:transposase